MHLLKHPQRQALLLIFVLFGLILQSAFAMEQARTRLAVTAAKNLNALWALQLDDGKDTAAAAYLTNAAEAGAEQTPLTFLNQDGKQQPLFRAQGDDYWRPDRYAQEALSYSKSHDRFPGHNLRGNITRSVWQGVRDKTSETGRAFGEQITTAPWATVKAVSGAMASGAWAVARHPLQSAENFGKEVLRLGKDAAFNLGSGATSAWAGYRGAENPLNELYGQNMGPALLSLGSAQGVLTAAQAIPMMKGAQALGKGMQALGKGALQTGKTVGGKELFQFERGEGVTSAGVSGKAAGSFGAGGISRSSAVVKEGGYSSKGGSKIGGKSSQASVADDSINVGGYAPKGPDTQPNIGARPDAPNRTPDVISDGVKTWNKATFDGRSVYKNDNAFDADYVDPGTGWTNKKRMAEGYAPIGKDGKPVELHHMTQSKVNSFNGSRGAVAEVGKDFHSKNYNAIHIYKRGDPEYVSWRKNNPQVARQFDSYRKNYWKERTNDF